MPSTLEFEYLAMELLLISFPATISPEGLLAIVVVEGKEVVTGVVVVVDEVVVDGVGGTRKTSHRAPIRVGGQMQIGIVVVSNASSSS